MVPHEFQVGSERVPGFLRVLHAIWGGIRRVESANTHSLGTVGMYWVPGGTENHHRSVPVDTPRNPPPAPGGTANCRPLEAHRTTDHHRSVPVGIPSNRPPVPGGTANCRPLGARCTENHHRSVPVGIPSNRPPVPGDTANCRPLEAHRTADHHRSVPGDMPGNPPPVPGGTVNHWPVALRWAANHHRFVPGCISVHRSFPQASAARGCSIRTCRFSASAARARPDTSSVCTGQT